MVAAAAPCAGTANTNNQMRSVLTSKPIQRLYRMHSSRLLHASRATLSLKLTYGFDRSPLIANLTTLAPAGADMRLPVPPPPGSNGCRRVIDRTHRASRRQMRPLLTTSIPDGSASGAASSPEGSGLADRLSASCQRGERLLVAVGPNR